MIDAASPVSAGADTDADDIASGDVGVDVIAVRAFFSTSSTLTSRSCDLICFQLLILTTALTT